MLLCADHNIHAGFVVTIGTGFPCKCVYLGAGFSLTLAHCAPKLGLDDLVRHRASVVTDCMRPFEGLSDHIVPQHSLCCMYRAQRGHSMCHVLHSV
jgi:hypothetical protein